MRLLTATLLVFTASPLFAQVKVDNYTDAEMEQYLEYRRAQEIRPLEQLLQQRIGEEKLARGTAARKIRAMIAAIRDDIKAKEKAHIHWTKASQPIGTLAAGECWCANQPIHDGWFKVVNNELKGLVLVEQVNPASRDQFKREFYVKRSITPKSLQLGSIIYFRGLFDLTPVGADDSRDATILIERADRPWPGEVGLDLPFKPPQKPLRAMKPETNPGTDSPPR